MANEKHLAILGLGVLEQQRALKGYNAPPDVVMKIEDLRAKIAALERGEG